MLPTETRCRTRSATAHHLGAVTSNESVGFRPGVVRHGNGCALTSLLARLSGSPCGGPTRRTKSYPAQSRRHTAGWRQPSTDIAQPKPGRPNSVVAWREEQRRGRSGIEPRLADTRGRPLMPRGRPAPAATRYGWLTCWVLVDPFTLIDTDTVVPCCTTPVTMPSAGTGTAVVVPSVVTSNVPPVGTSASYV
jgi:hypothetical protein